MAGLKLEDALFMKKLPNKWTIDLGRNQAKKEENIQENGIDTLVKAIRLRW